MRSLGVIGNVNVDLILGPLTPWPQAGTEVMVEHDDLRVGGSAGNAALAWAALGVPHAIFANVGNDTFGRWLKEGFGAQSAAWPVEEASTTISVGVTHPDGERTFLTSRGHLPLFSWAGAKPMLEGVGLDGGILLVCGSFLTEKLVAEYDALFAFAAERGIDIALDTGWPLAGWTREVLDATYSWLPHVSHLLFNEIETTQLAGIDDLGEATAALLPRLRPGGTVVVKQGPNGASALSAEGPVRVDAPRVEVVDTIGAGDVFNAGYLMAVAAGKPIGQALHSGTRLASRAVSSLPRVYDFGES